MKDEVIITVIATGLEEQSVASSVLKEQQDKNLAKIKQTEEESKSDEEEPKPVKELRPIRDMNDGDQPFDIPIFLRGRRN